MGTLMENHNEFDAELSISGVQFSVSDLNTVEDNDREIDEDMAAHVLNGLSQTPKKLSSMYFYDSIGSSLYEKITEQEEYYLYDCEKQNFNKHKHTILKHLISSGDNDASCNIVELGAGDGSKTRILLEYFLDENLDFVYMPVDISRKALEQLSEFIDKNFEASNSKLLRVQGIVGDNLKSLDYISKKTFGKTRNVVLFLGSSIGNYSHEDAVAFLRLVWKNMNDGDIILIGFDLQKDPNTMMTAYNDSKGYTREFNFNLLERLNKSLSANFNRKKFQHYHLYNPTRRCMESWLMSKESQSVRVGALNKSYDFAAWEGIHVEDSFKYNEKDLDTLAEACGFEILENLYDPKGFFVDSLWKVVKH